MNYAFINFINNAHFDYLKLNENNETYGYKNQYIEYILKFLEKNEKYLEDIRKP